MQTATAFSKAEAEFSALSACVREDIWIRSVLGELSLPITKSTLICQDNLGAISWTEQVQDLREVKHVVIKYHCVRLEVEKKSITLAYTSSETNRADSYTKALISDTFKSHRNRDECDIYKQAQ